jgi:hypothetical protein
MKLKFIFTDTPNISSLPTDQLYPTSFDVPDAALHLIGVRERILAVAELMGSFTHGSLHLTCKELDLKLHPIKLTEYPKEQWALRHANKALVICFQRHIYPFKKVLLKVFAPSVDCLPSELFFVNKRWNLKPLAERWPKTDEQFLFAQRLSLLAQHLEVLLNADPDSNWKCIGFHPLFPDATIETMQRNRRKQRTLALKKKERDEAKALKQREKDEAKRLKREEMIKSRAEAQPNTEAPQHGAGRRPGARPGIYKGIQMRSQLEIRFAAELDERNIRWFYESEALGDAGYLVDFYLPDLGVWVEVKGTIIAKDRQVLPEVARHLRQTRNHRLMMYMQSKAYVINPSGFREIEAKRFWDELVK